MPRPGAKGVNVMHLTLVEREAWQHGYKDGHVEGVRKGEAELAKRIAEVDVKIAALEAIIGTLARPLDELDTAIETELTRLALTIAKHLVRRELQDRSHAGHRHHPPHREPAAAGGAQHQDSPASRRRGHRAREARAAPRASRNGSSPKIRSWRAAAAA